MLYSVNDRYLFDSERCIVRFSNLSELDAETVNTVIPVQKIRSDIFESCHSDATCCGIASKSLPYSGGIIITYKCHLRCNYCSYDSDENGIDQLDITDIEAFVRFLLKNRMLRNLVSDDKHDGPLSFTFSGGGEPTYNTDFFRRAVFAVERICAENDVPLSLQLTTNGVNVGIVDFIAEHFDSVMLSFDGIRTVQNKNRPFPNLRQSYDVAAESLKRLCENSDKVKTIVRSTLWQEDYQHIFEIADNLMADYPEISVWSVSPMHAGGRGGINSTDSDFSMSDVADFSRIYFELKQYLQTHKAPFVFNSPMFWSNKVEIYCGQVNTPAAWLLPNGRISTCLDSYKFSPILGLIKNGKLTKYERYENILLKTAIQKLYDCSDCMAYPFCKGGCPLRYLYTSDSASAGVKWECEMRRRYWKHILSVIIDGGTIEGVILRDNEELSKYGVKHIECQL